MADDAFWALLRRLVDLEPDRVWTLRELAQGTGLSLLDAKVAVEGLVFHGELVRRGGDHYARPVRGDDGR